MAESSHFQISPYTRERSRSLQRSYLKLNSIGLAIMSAGHVVLGLFYGDLLMASYFGAFVVFGIAYAFICCNVSHNAYVVIGEFLIVVGVAGSQFVLPSGLASAILLFPLGVALMALSHTLLRGVVVLVIGLGLFFSFPLLALEYSSQNLVPGILSYSVTLFYCVSILLFQVSKARQSVGMSISHLTAIESELNVKEGDLKKYQGNLCSLNVELDENVKMLVRTFEKESAANVELLQERSSQEELTKAIHRDLRDPLRKIVTANERLAKYFSAIPEAKTVSSYLDYATDGAKRMTTMLDDLLKYTEMNAPQQVQHVDLNLLLATIRQDLSDLVGRSGATINASQLPVVEGFATQLQQLFQNLLTNALKFSRPGVAPKVNIFAAEIQDKPGRFMIRVRDNGVGIPANQLESVFGLFNRAHSKEGYEGSGVGLALCRRIAVAHNAELTVASVQGEGTQFTIAMPIESIVREVGEKVRLSVGIERTI